MMLKIENAEKRFGQTVAVSNVNLQIRQGEFCVLLGASGAGKSTVLGMINGLVEPTNGVIEFDGVRVTPRTLREIRPRMAMVHQQHNLVPRLSVLKNVAAGALPRISMWRSLLGLLPQDIQQLSCQLLQEVGLVEEHLYRRAMQLSGGEQQRVAIARAFIMNPDLVLADEPVASLDPKTSVAVLERLRQASRAHGATVLCSLHQVDLARQFADRIVAMKNGGVVFDGPPDQLDATELNAIYDN